MLSPEKESSTPKGVLFVDFNGVISYDPFWASLSRGDHPLSIYFEQIEELLMRRETRVEGLIEDWMIGKYTSEQIHQFLADRLGVPYQELFDTFCEDCRKLDISKPILEAVGALTNNWYRVLRTDNMDSFDRFTLPSNPAIAEAFDEIQNSYQIKQLKKTNGGEYFLKTISDRGLTISDCVLIDDSGSTCRVFEQLGGESFQTHNESEVVDVLRNLLNR